MPSTSVKKTGGAATTPTRGGAKRPAATSKRRSAIERDRLNLSATARTALSAGPPVEPTPDAPPPVAPPPAPPPPAAPPPVVSDPLQAIGMALEEKPVRFPNLEGEPELLVIKSAGTNSDIADFDVALGKNGLRLSVPTAMADPAHLVESLRLIYRIPDQYKGAVRAMQIKSQDDYSARIVDLAGQEQKIAIRKTGTTGEGAINYQMSLGSYELSVKSPPGNDISMELSQAVHLYLGIPPHLRFALKEVRIDNNANPTDAYWAEKYNIKDFTSAATGGNGVANFWHGSRYFTDSYFFHELGHVVGQHFSTKNLLIPDGWEDQIAADNRVVSDYGKTSPAEDFAESFMLYQRCKSGQAPYNPDDPASEAEFKQRFPNRSRVLEAIFDGSRKPVAKGDVVSSITIPGSGFKAA